MKKASAALHAAAMGLVQPPSNAWLSFRYSYRNATMGSTRVARRAGK